MRGKKQSWRHAELAAFIINILCNKRASTIGKFGTSGHEID